MKVPFFRINVLTGLKGARLIADPPVLAQIIKKARRPLLVLGARVSDHLIGDRLHVEYCLELRRKTNIPICATANVKKKVLELGDPPESTYDVVEIINALKDPGWPGVRKEGNHDLVLFSGVRCDLAEQVLSSLKHFAPHLKTVALCRFSHPNAHYALPVLNPDRWKDYWDGLLDSL